MSQVSAVTFLSILRAIVQQTKLTEETLLAISQVDSTLFSQEDARIDAEKLSTMFHFAMQESGDPHLALHIGESIPYQSLGLLGYMLINAPTIGEMLERFQRYQKLVGQNLKYHFSEDDSHYLITIYINENPFIPVPQFHAEVHMSAIMHIINQMAGTPIIPTRTHFTHPLPNDLSEYHRLFGPTIRFGQNENCLFLAKDALQIPLQFSNPIMLRYFESQADRILEDMESASWYAQTKRVILKHIGDKEMTADFVADKLDVSLRTLQKHLKSESKTFRNALSSVRRQLAQHYLQNTRLEIGEIALLLGYSESSAFLRAYKVWTGTTPGAFRK